MIDLSKIRSFFGFYIINYYIFLIDNQVINSQWVVDYIIPKGNHNCTTTSNNNNRVVDYIIPKGNHNVRS